MKLSGWCIPLLCLAVASLSGCSDDENKPLPELKQSSYSGTSLTITYCGENSPAKVVELMPGADDKATLKVSGMLDLSTLGIKDIPVLPAPGIIPGTAEVGITVTLEAGDKGNYTFSGSDETSYASFNYSGEITEGHLTLNITDAVLKNQAYAGKAFSLQPLECSLKDLAAAGGLENMKSPFHIVWEVTNLPGLTLDPGLLLNALTLAPVFPVYDGTAEASAAQLLESTVETIALTGNGNVPVRYWSSKEGAIQLMTTAGNMIQYVAVGPAQLQMYLNPMSAVGMWLVSQSKPTWLPSFFDTAYADKIKDQIASESSSSSVSAEDAELQKILMEALLQALSPALRDGVPVAVSPTADGVDIYLDTATCVKFVSQLAKDLLAEPAVAQRVVALLAEAGVSTAEAQKLLAALPVILQATNKLEIGLSLQSQGD